MAQPGHEPGLGPRPGQRQRVVEGVVVEYLDRDVAVKQQVTSAEHLRHAAGTQPGHQSVAAAQQLRGGVHPAGSGHGLARHHGREATQQPG